jgi:hypothetical protein
VAQTTPHSDIDCLHAAPCPCIAPIDTAPRITTAALTPARPATPRHRTHTTYLHARATVTAIAALALTEASPTSDRFLTTPPGVSAGRFCQHGDTRPRRFLATTSETCPLQQPGDDSAKA